MTTAMYLAGPSTLVDGAIAHRPTFVRLAATESTIGVAALLGRLSAARRANLLIFAGAWRPDRIATIDDFAASARGLVALLDSARMADAERVSLVLRDHLDCGLGPLPSSLENEPRLDAIFQQFTERLAGIYTALGLPCCVIRSPPVFGGFVSSISGDSAGSLDIGHWLDQRLAARVLGVALPTRSGRFQQSVVFVGALVDAAAAIPLEMTGHLYLARGTSDWGDPQVRALTGEVSARGEMANPRHDEDARDGAGNRTAHLLQVDGLTQKTVGTVERMLRSKLHNSGS